ncbi:hypothetical protein [uncultured Jatrophihabitans sp.]|uniref:hypothetical protein n=1 Tax=uncultured Jatrophihabitans sp. TaxID=1610747 RepID=UPI0035CC6CD8
MATIDRIDSGYTAWTPSSAGLATDDETYTGRHRRPESSRALSLRRLFYMAKHRR